MKYEYFAQLVSIQLSQSEVQSGHAAKTVNEQIVKIIEHFTEKGFEFHNQITLPTTISPGCLAGLLGVKSSTIDLPVSVFRKLKSE